ESRILQRAALVTDVPYVTITAVNFFFRHFDGDLVALGIFDGVFSGDDVPFAPGRDHFQVRGQRLIGQLEADLIVTLSRAAVHEGVGAFLGGDLHLPLGENRPRHGGAQQIFVLVNRPGAQRGVNIIRDELFAQVLDVELAGAGLYGFRFQPFEFVPLPD